MAEVYWEATRVGAVTPPLRDEKIERCMGYLAEAKRYAPRETAFNERYLMEWAVFKRHVASAAAKCIGELLGDVVKEIYYIELSDSEIGRDVDLYMKLEPEKASRIDPAELEETLEAVLLKLSELAGLNARLYTSAPSVFEVHTDTGGIYGSRRLPRSVRAIRLYP